MSDYRINNAESFRRLLGDEAPYPDDDTIRAAGFNPADPELTACYLAEDYNGHAAGALVLHGLIVTGYRFAVLS